jgi:hypothetical protein
MKKLNSILLISMCLTLWGCFVFPLRTIEPLKITVIDASTGTPIEGAIVLRLVCDIHNRDCNNAFIDMNVTNDKGIICLSGKRDFGPWMAAPGGLPVPNHQIAIWKEGYSAFVFSQYDNDIDRFSARTRNKNIIEAVRKIPKERKYLSLETNPYSVFDNGIIKLYRLELK